MLPCRRNLAATFRSHILNSRDADNIVNHTPVRVLGSCSFMYMRHGDVYILGVTKQNANVMMAFRFMTNVSVQPRYMPRTIRPCFSHSDILTESRCAQYSSPSVWTAFLKTPRRSPWLMPYLGACRDEQHPVAAFNEAVLDMDCCAYTGGEPVQIILWRGVQRAEHKEQLCAHL